MKRPRILIVDDEHDIRAFLRLALQDQGYFVWTATTGSHAFRILELIKRPRLVLLDLNMPLMNGLEFLKKKQEDPRYRDIPVIVMSATPGAKQVLKGLPIAGFIKKPVDLSLVIQILKPYFDTCSEEEFADDTETANLFRDQ